MGITALGWRAGLATAAVVGVLACGSSEAPLASLEDLNAVLEERGLSSTDARAALETYTPGGTQDPYLLFASGGHSGQVLVVGVPSMRILKVIGVFSPESGQGYGYGDATQSLLAGGPFDGITHRPWGDSRQPALSERGGEYDGEYLFVSDKAHARVAVIGLEDFVTKQILSSPLIRSDHGSTVVTPDTEYVIQATQYPAPLGGAYAPIEQFAEKYRGAVIFWKFDRDFGKLVPEESWAIELPPYMQDVADVGKLASDGWLFMSSFNSERAWGNDLEGKPPLEAGSAMNETDYLHLIDWRSAEKLIQEDRGRKIAGMRVLPLEVAAEAGVLHFVPAPKNPHGVALTPDGSEIVVSGKLDSHVTVYRFDAIRELIEAKKTTGKDPYGVPILPFDAAIRGQVELGLGPLHTQFDDRGFAYTSLFVESQVAQWSLADLEVTQKIPVHYNVGHLATVEGDTVSPDGGYLVALNQWSLDRFNPVGPQKPQSLQLIDIRGDSMSVLYDLPVPLGAPHSAQMIQAAKLEPNQIYSPPGLDPLRSSRSIRRIDGSAVADGKQGIDRKVGYVEVRMTAVRSHFTPDLIRVKQGDLVSLHITNLEQAEDATHGLAIAFQDFHLNLQPGEHANLLFRAREAGVFPFYSTEAASVLHEEMAGYLLVEPRLAREP